MLPQSILATYLLRRPLRDLASSYMAEPRAADPVVLPLIKGWFEADRAIFRPLDELGGRDPAVELAMARFTARKRERAMRHQEFADNERR